MIKKKILAAIVAILLSILSWVLYPDGRVHNFNGSYMNNPNGSHTIFPK